MSSLNSFIQFFPRSEAVFRFFDHAADCTPILSTLTNAAELFYQSVHKTDSLNPVQPGWRTTLKIHVLRKERLHCIVGLIPVVGNLFHFVKNVVSFLRNWSQDSALEAFKEDIEKCREEIVLLRLQNRPPEAWGPLYSRELLAWSTLYSSENVFDKMLDHCKRFWSDSAFAKNRPDYKDFLGDQCDLYYARYTYSYALKSSLLIADQAKATKILAHWKSYLQTEHLNGPEIFFTLRQIKSFLDTDQNEFANQLIEILPNKIPFLQIEGLLLHLSSEELNEQRTALIQKTARPSLREIENFLWFFLFGKDHHSIHYDSFNHLLQLPQPQMNEQEELLSLPDHCRRSFFVKGLPPESQALLLKAFPNCVSFLGANDSEAPTEWTSIVSASWQCNSTEVFGKLLTSQNWPIHSLTNGLYFSLLKEKPANFEAILGHLETRLQGAPLFQSQDCQGSAAKTLAYALKNAPSRFTPRLIALLPPDLPQSYLKQITVLEEHSSLLLQKASPSGATS